VPHYHLGTWLKPGGGTAYGFVATDLEDDVPDRDPSGGELGRHDRQEPLPSTKTS
jgi:hypothetical protein